MYCTVYCVLYCVLLVVACARCHLLILSCLQLAVQPSVTVRSLLPVHKCGTAYHSDIRLSTPSLDTFKKRLKSYLFQLSLSSL